jgi:AcrR family transcriptional regulator
MESVKDKIAYHARRLFDKHGFHGTSLRDVCKLAGCKMPTIYYYYENKEKLFDEVVRVAFEELVEQLWTQLPKDVSYREYNIQKVIQKKHLSEDERIIYRLAMKTWLKCEGFDECRNKLIEWEQKAYRIAWEEYAAIVGSVRWAKFIARSITQMIQRIILLEEDIPDSEIVEEINMIFDVATRSNNNI